MSDLLAPLLDFMDRGGPVMWPMIATTSVLWALIAERIWFNTRQYPAMKHRALDEWSGRSEKASWYAECQRRMHISALESVLIARLKIIGTMIALLPMFGLLGTVTGMLQVFEVMALLGSGNPRALATGVSAATIPTMAGMVIALVALPFSNRLDQFARKASRELTESFTRE
ncbi:MAG: MotA/TolQ/ExbB proton channel family protein [Pseudomonadales bacterium]|jgi:biopolymer transport protein ExbB